MNTNRAPKRGEKEKNLSAVNTAVTQMEWRFSSESKLRVASRYLQWEEQAQILQKSPPPSVHWCDFSGAVCTNRV